MGDWAFLSRLTEYPGRGHGSGTLVVIAVGGRVISSLKVQTKKMLAPNSQKLWRQGVIAILVPC